jgi:hypothetical protein
LLSRTLKVWENKVHSELRICLLNIEYSAYLIIQNSPILHCGVTAQEGYPGEFFGKKRILPFVAA